MYITLRRCTLRVRYTLRTQKLGLLSVIVTCMLRYRYSENIIGLYLKVDSIQMQLWLLIIGIGDT